MSRRRHSFPILACLFVASCLTHEATSSGGLHPVVLVPAYTCGNLDARLTDKYRPPAAFPWRAARRGKGWFRLWENRTPVVLDPKQVPCYADQLRLVYDHAAGDYRNAPGVQTRVVAFGSTRGFGSDDDPATKNMCMQKLVKTLEGVGYRDGENLFGAPYDLRYSAAPPGQASREFSKFLSGLTALVEHASARNGGRPVILVSHSLGGLYANEFLSRSPLPWRRRHVKHFVMLSAGASGSTVALQFLASTVGAASPPPGDVLSFANTSRSFASTLGALPSPKAYGRAPLVVTQAKNFSAYDVPEFLAAVGFSEGDVAARYVARALPVALSFEAPRVPMTSVAGVGVPTPEKLVFWDGEFGAGPRVVYGDGDGAVNVENVLALGEVVGKDPRQPYFRSVFLPNTTHGGIISDGLALKLVVSEILEAGQAIYYQYS